MTARDGDWLTRWRLRTCEAVGSDPQLRGRPDVYAEGGRIRIGDRFRLSSRPVASHLASGPGATLEIGHDVAIGHGAAIAAYEQVRIGDGTSIGPYVLLMDTNFHGRTGDQSVQHETKPVLIGTSCRIGSRVTITRGAVIGDGAEILAGSVVSSVIPPGACAGGARARVLGRAGDAACRWDGAAALLPELLREALGSPAVPELDADLSSFAWTERSLCTLTAAIERELETSVDADTVRRTADLRQLVATIERTRRANRSR